MPKRNLRELFIDEAGNIVDIINSCLIKDEIFPIGPAAARFKYHNERVYTKIKELAKRKGITPSEKNIGYSLHIYNTQIGPKIIAVQFYQINSSS